jgi:predicted  nucleic acid-binding Zn-ribbon protein
MSKREEFITNMGNRLKEWNAELDKLEDKVMTVKVELQEKYRQQIADLRKKRERAEKKLEEAKAAGEGAWENMRGETERAWAALKDGFAAFKSHYQAETDKQDQEE